MSSERNLIRKVDTKVDFCYLDGDLKFIPWSHTNSLDVFILCDKKSENKTYSYTKLKNQLFKFNTVDRVMMYNHEYKIDGIDHCYDCRCEIFIMEEYLKSNDLIFGYFRLKKQTKSVVDLIKELNEYLEASKHYIKMQFDKKDYMIKFTSIKYGDKFEQVFKKSKITK